MNLDFANLQTQLPGAELKWLQQLRSDAFSFFEKKGFPTRFDEDWKYMKTQALVKEFSSLSILDSSLNCHPGQANERNASRDPEKYLASLLESGQGLRPFWDARMETNISFILFIDGQFVKSNLPKNSQVEIFSIKDALQKNPQLVEKYLNNNQISHSLIALNQALMTDGIVIHVPENTVIQQPIYGLFMNEHKSVMHYSHHLIIAEKNSAVTIVEKHFSNTKQVNYFSNHITDCFALENARIEHIKLIQEAEESFHFSHLNIHQHKSSSVKSHLFTLSGNWIRSDIHVDLNEIDAEVELNGLFIAKKQQQVDHHTTVNHLKPQGRSAEVYKGIVDDAAQATFNGKVIVALDAQKTSATQASKNLLLSKQAEINTKPELQIYADDVKCSHGATVGQLDENALFYLCSRGVSYDYAKNLLLYGFALEQIDKIEISLLKQYLKDSLELLHHV